MGEENLPIFLRDKLSNGEEIQGNHIKITEEPVTKVGGIERRRDRDNAPGARVIHKKGERDFYERKANTCQVFPIIRDKVTEQEKG